MTDKNPSDTTDSPLHPLWANICARRLWKGPGHHGNISCSPGTKVLDMHALGNYFFLKSHILGVSNTLKSSVYNSTGGPLVLGQRWTDGCMNSRIISRQITFHCVAHHNGIPMLLVIYFYFSPQNLYYIIGNVKCSLCTLISYNIHILSKSGLYSNFDIAALYLIWHYFKYNVSIRQTKRLSIWI